MDLSLQRVRNYMQWRRNQRVNLAPENREPLRKLLALLAPQRAQGKRKKRIGASRDGGYVMLDDFEGIEAALSLGVGPDVSWDYALAERGIPVWQYDHTVTSLPQQHPLFHFEPRRIVTEDSTEEGVTLGALLQNLAGKQILLKMDIEGDEWKIFADLNPEQLGHCRQIVVEFHHFLSIHNPAWHETATRALEHLSKNFGVVHVHGNNLSKHIVLDDEVLPDSLEVTFADREFYQIEATDETFPSPLDRKNNLFFPDFNLGHFRF